MNKLDHTLELYKHFAQAEEYMPWHALGLAIVTTLFVVHLIRTRPAREHLSAYGEAFDLRVGYAGELIAYVLVLAACHYFSFVIYALWIVKH